MGARREGPPMLPVPAGRPGDHVICSRAQGRGESDRRTVLCTLRKGKVKCISSLLSLQEACTLCVHVHVHMPMCACVRVRAFAAHPLSIHAGTLTGRRVMSPGNMYRL